MRNEKEKWKKDEGRKSNVKPRKKGNKENNSRKWNEEIIKKKEKEFIFVLNSTQSCILGGRTDFV